MFKKVLTLFVLFITIVSLIGCRPEIELSDRVNLKINNATGNALRTLTYNTGSPLTLPDGSIYTNGKLKPVWNYISNHLNVSLTDTTIQGQTAAYMIQTAAATDFVEADIFGGSAAEDFMQYGARGKLVNLLDYAEKLPDFINYLDKYPLIKQYITAYDGGIYHIPYIAEMDEFSKVFYGRHNWIKALLDNEYSLELETTTLDIAYSGYWRDASVRNSSNVIMLQNQTTVSDKLSSSAARNVLINYIDQTYPELDRRSDLYLGKGAMYDVDELIALWRVMKLHPRTLYKLTTGKSGSCEIIPYFFRTKNNREDIFKFINYFGGTRVYGTNTYTGKWFADESNTLQYSFYQDEVFEGIDYLKQIYSEGLINPDYDDTNNSADYRSLFYSSDLNVNANGESTVRQLGFMTFDFIPSTAASSSTGAVQAILPPLTKLEGMHDDNFYHYVEIPRTIMIDGWSISAHTVGDKLDKALELFNFFFTDFGSNVQNFGIPSVTAEFENLFTLPDGRQVPTISTWLTEQARIYTLGDVARFSQEFMGIRMAIGYKADIGFEYQYMTQEALLGYALYEESNVMMLGYSKSSKLLELSAPCFSLTKQEISLLQTLSIGDDQLSMTYLYIKSDKNAPSSVAQIKQSYENANIDTLISIYRAAYDRTKQ